MRAGGLPKAHAARQQSPRSASSFKATCLNAWLFSTACLGVMGIHHFLGTSCLISGAPTIALQMKQLTFRGPDRQGHGRQHLRAGGLSPRCCPGSSSGGNSCVLGMLPRAKIGLEGQGTCAAGVGWGSGSAQVLNGRWHPSGAGQNQILTATHRPCSTRGCHRNLANSWGNQFPLLASVPTRERKRSPAVALGTRHPARERFPVEGCGRCIAGQDWLLYTVCQRGSIC